MRAHWQKSREVHPLALCMCRAAPQAAEDGSVALDLVFLLTCPLEELEGTPWVAGGLGENTIALQATVLVPSPGADDTAPVLQGVEFLE